MDLLQKFEEIKIDNTERIRESDRICCQNLNDTYSKALTHYQSILEKMYEIDLKHEDPFEIRKDDKWDRVCSKKHGEDLWAYNDDGSPSKYILTLKSSIQVLHTQFIRKVVEYFASTYGIGLNKERFEKRIGDNLKITWQEILDLVFEYIGDEELENKGIQEFKDYFKKQIRWPDQLKVNKNKISLHDQVFFCHWSSNLEFSSSSGIDYFIKALSFFEFDVLEYSGTFYHSLPNNRSNLSLDLYETPLSSKFKGLKLFKNGRVDLVFRSEEYAKEFVSLYCLDQEED